MSPILTHAIAFVAGALISYLALRNNPRYKAKVDAITDKVEAKIDKR